MVELFNVLSAAHAPQILLFLHRNREPAPTNRIMNAIGVSNWGTAASSLQKLEEAGLVVMRVGSVGRYKSRARLWALEPNLGVKVAYVLEELSRVGSQHARTSLEAPKGLERVGIADLELAREKLATVVQEITSKVAPVLAGAG